MTFEEYRLALFGPPEDPWQPDLFAWEKLHEDATTPFELHERVTRLENEALERLGIERPAEWGEYHERLCEHFSD